MFSPKLKITGAVLSTLQGWANELRKVKFIVENTFAWGTWDPELQASGSMTISDKDVHYAEYLKIWDFVWFRFNISLTTGGTGDTNIYVENPVEPKYRTAEAFTSWVVDASDGAISAHSRIAQSNFPNWITVMKYDSGNFNLGATRILSSGFYRAAKPGNVR